MAAVVGGTFACLELGLDYVEGKVSGRELVQRVLQKGVIAGGGAFVTTGIMVGISLLFPFLIPILAPVLLVLQVASLALTGAKGVKLAKGWWPVLARQQLPVHSAISGSGQRTPQHYQDTSNDGGTQHPSFRKFFHRKGSRAYGREDSASVPLAGQWEGRRANGLKSLAKSC